ncbi:hypothetical protein PALB_8200 [Pseudoalteromonas luteoviolacea B = ATCC 29581]|nr:hypothetical protein PALB_8200 [Pseudoalteromonas luteoviolacea B = ATCC 29581]
MIIDALSSIKAVIAVRDLSQAISFFVIEGAEFISTRCF